AGCPAGDGKDEVPGRRGERHGGRHAVDRQDLRGGHGPPVVPVARDVPRRRRGGARARRGAGLPRRQERAAARVVHHGDRRKPGQGGRQADSRGVGVAGVATEAAAPVAVCAGPPAAAGDAAPGPGLRGRPPGFWRALDQAPYAYDLFNVPRWIAARAGARAPLGRDTVPRNEPVRMRQEPSMAFAPSTLASVRPARAGRPPELSIYSFGLFGPNWHLPLPLTEYARGRMQPHGDPTLSAFADVFHHRLILLFYRAWA